MNKYVKAIGGGALVIGVAGAGAAGMDAYKDFTAPPPAPETQGTVEDPNKMDSDDYKEYRKVVIEAGVSPELITTPDKSPQAVQTVSVLRKVLQGAVREACVEYDNGFTKSEFDGDERDLFPEAEAIDWACENDPRRLGPGSFDQVYVIGNGSLISQQSKEDGTSEPVSTVSFVDFESNGKRLLVIEERLASDNGIEDLGEMLLKDSLHHMFTVTDSHHAMSVDFQLDGYMEQKASTEFDKYLEPEKQEAWLEFQSRMDDSEEKIEAETSFRVIKIEGEDKTSNGSQVEWSYDDIDFEQENVIYDLRSDGIPVARIVIKEGGAAEIQNGIGHKKYAVEGHVNTFMLSAYIGDPEGSNPEASFDYLAFGRNKVAFLNSSVRSGQVDLKEKPDEEYLVGTIGKTKYHPTEFYKDGIKTVRHLNTGHEMSFKEFMIMDHWDR